MDVKSLEEALIAQKLRGWYLNGGTLDNTHTIGRTTYGWEVYYSERGHKTGLKTFATENEACQFFLATLRGNTSAQE